MEGAYPTIEEIADLCLEKYEKLSKTGKPNVNEWTVLAAVVMSCIDNAGQTCARVVALATGTKCLAADKMCATGLKLNDSHAEVLARRALMRFFYAQMLQLPADESIFVWNELSACYELKTNVSFHFFSTRLPCGDACIPNHMKSEQNEDKTEDGQPLPKHRKYEEDNVIYTGAKLINIIAGGDRMAQNPSALRLKPGKGVRTSSMSCSDKLARWNIMGVQGALLYALLLQPIYFRTINILDADAQILALQRAIYERFKNSKCTPDFGYFQMQKPQIRVIAPSCERFFPSANSIDAAAKRPSPLALVWCDINCQKIQQCEVCVDGRRQGVPAKRHESPQSALNISKYHNLKSFVGLTVMHKKLHERLELKADNGRYAYNKCKQSAKQYVATWTKLRCDLFAQWTSKSKHYEEFSIVHEN